MEPLIEYRNYSKVEQTKTVSKLSQAEFVEIAFNFNLLKEKMQAIEYSISPDLVFECFNSTYVVVNYTDSNGNTISKSQKLIDF